MKVNILGRGIIPGVGTIPPQYGLDLPEHKISNILKYASFKVYVTSTGVPVTKKNLVQLIALEAQKNASTPLTLKVEPSAPVKKEEVKKEEAPVTEAPVVEEVKEETPVVEETVAEEIKEEIKEEEAAVEETVEEAPVVEEVKEEVKTTSKKKKK